MSERYFTVDRQLEGNVVWTQDAMDVNPELTETMNESYATAEEDSPTRYLSVLDTTSEISLENLNITLTNPKLETEEEAVETYTEVFEPQEDNSNEVVVFTVDGSDELFGMQVVQDDEGNLQKYQFQFRRTEDGQLEAIPETITMVPMDENEGPEPEPEPEPVQVEQEVYPEEIQQGYVEGVPSGSLSDHVEDEENDDHYENPMEEVDVKTGILQNVKEEALENQLDDISEEDLNFHQEVELPEEEALNLQDQEFEHVEVSPDMEAVQAQDEYHEEGGHDSDENEYQIVEGVHITGDLENPEEDSHEKQNANILKHVLKSTQEQKLVKRDNKLYLYVVQHPEHPEKENVDSLSMEMASLCRKVNPRSILKSSHAMFQSRNEVDKQEDRMSKRFSRGKESAQAKLFHNFINKTTIPQAPVRKHRLPRKQKISPVERMDEEIVVQEMMVSSNGFVEAVHGGVNKENLAITEYVELTDSDDDYEPKRTGRKKKRHRRKRHSIVISDESDTSHDSVIELDESDDEPSSAPPPAAPSPKRRRGRPPKNKPPADLPENPTKPEIPCPKCEKTFPSENSLKTHLQHHNLQSSLKRALPEYKYKCDKCATTFINSILLKKHMCSKLFNCGVCKKNFTEVAALNAHKRTHAKEQMVKDTQMAQVSPKRAKAPSNGNAFKVPKLATVKCKKCGKLCSSLQNLNIHMRSHKEFKCTTCLKIFPSQLLLEKHLRESCVKSPRQKVKNEEALKVRTRSLAGGNLRRSSILRVKCDICSMMCNGYEAMFKHKVVSHGLDTPDKSVLKKETNTGRITGGVPAAKRLQKAYEGLRCQLDFDG